MRRRRKVPLTPAQQELAARNLGLARFHALRFARGAHLDYEECEGEAMYALCDAAGLYDPERGAQFSTYASWAIINRLRRMLEVHRRRPDGAALSLLPIRSDGFDTYSSEGGWYTQPHAPEGEPACDVDDALAEALRPLHRREREVLAMRFRAGLTLKEVGERLGVTRSRVQQIEQRSLARAREALAGAV